MSAKPKPPAYSNINLDVTVTRQQWYALLRFLALRRIEYNIAQNEEVTRAEA